MALQLGVLITGLFFCLQVDGPITRGLITGGGGGVGLITGILRQHIVSRVSVAYQSARKELFPAMI